MHTFSLGSLGALGHTRGPFSRQLLGSPPLDSVSVLCPLPDSRNSSRLASQLTNLEPSTLAQPRVGLGFSREGGPQAPGTGLEEGAGQLGAPAARWL